MFAAGEQILGSIHEARAILRGEAQRQLVVHAPAAVDVKTIRRRLGMSQAQFAAAFGLELHAIRNWEQGRCRPQRAARAYLMVIEREPEAVRRALVA